MKSISTEEMKKRVLVNIFGHLVTFAKNKIKCLACEEYMMYHKIASQETIDELVAKGCTVDVCFEHRVRKGQFWIVISSVPAENPCDDDFMREIST